jgi:hypothetical protein
MKVIDDKNKVGAETIRLYDEIDGLRVIEDLLLFKGTEDRKNDMFFKLADLEKMALITYGLKVNATNKLYVGWYLEKYYKRNGMFSDKGWVKIPKDIFDKVDALHNEFKIKQQP